MSVHENISEQGMGDLRVEGRYHFISFGFLIISLIANIYIEGMGLPRLFPKNPSGNAGDT